MNKLKFLMSSVISVPNRIINYLVLKYRGVAVGKNLRINGRLFLRGRGKISIGDNVTINSSLQSNPIGGSTKTVIHCMGGVIRIGDNVGISNTAIVCREEVIINDRVKIGGDVRIYDNDFHSTDYRQRRNAVDTDIKSASVQIGEDTFIGAACIILKGVSIGKRSIVAAGSVVTHNIPDDELWGGTPARFIRKL